MALCPSCVFLKYVELLLELEKSAKSLSHCLQVVYIYSLSWNRKTMSQKVGCFLKFSHEAASRWPVRGRTKRGVGAHSFVWWAVSTSSPSSSLNLLHMSGLSEVAFILLLGRKTRRGGGVIGYNWPMPNKRGKKNPKNSYTLLEAPHSVRALKETKFLQCLFLQQLYVRVALLLITLSLHQASMTPRAETTTWKPGPAGAGLRCTVYSFSSRDSS